jgi:LacI family transcriptional regulator
MKKRITIEQIAKKVGTSKITVSRALKGQDGVGIELRKKIIQVASDLGYEKNRLHTTGQKQVAFLVPKRFFLLTDSFYHVIFYYLNTLCNDDSKISLFILEKDKEDKGLLPIVEEDFDGIIVGGEVSPKIIDAINQKSIPYVVIDNDSLDNFSDCVYIDNFRIGIELTDYLVKRGYKKIGFVGSCFQTSNITDRFLGYQKIQYYYHLPMKNSWIIDNYNDKTDSYLMDISLPEDLPEDFICQCDRAAYYFMESLKSQGIDVPNQVALVSIDNTELASSTEPKLTCVNIDKSLFAAEALRLLNERIEGRCERSRVCLDSKLIERDSAPCKN